MDEAIKQKSKAHTQYKLADGTRVPGVTTILNVLNKPALVPWANNLGLEGIVSADFTKETGYIGTLAHAIMLGYFTGREITDCPLDYSQDQFDIASMCYQKGRRWADQYNIEVILAEEPLVSEEWHYGGTPDLFCKINGLFTGVDFKSSSGLYPENLYQCVGYDRLLKEHGHYPDQWILVGMSRNPEEDFDTKQVNNLDIQWGIFKNCLEIYELQKLERRK